MSISVSNYLLLLVILLGIYLFMYYYLLIFVLEYRQYPQDIQLIQIKCETYGSSGTYVDLNFTGTTDSEMLLGVYRLPGPVSFISNNGVLNIAINPIWRYISYTTGIDSKNYGKGLFDYICV